MFINIFYEQFIIIKAELWVLFFLVFVLGYCVLFENVVKLKMRNFRIFSHLTLILLTCICLFFEFLLLLNRLCWQINVVVFNYSYEIDFSSDFITCFLSFLLLIYFIIANTYWKEEEVFSFEWVILILLSYFGMLIVIHSGDFVSLYLGIELQSLPMYILAGYSKYSILATEAALKYFILGAFMSGILLFGISILYSLLGTVNFHELYILIFLCFENLDIYNFIFNWYFVMLLLGLVFIFVSLLFKLGIAPFHYWVPDIYQGVFSGVTVFFAVVPKVVILFILVKLFFFYDFLNISNFNNIMLFFGFLSIFFGTFGALYQINIKRLLAFGTVNHFGFIFIGLSLVDYFSIISSFIYLCVYLLLNINFFSFYLNVKYMRVNDFDSFSTFVYLYKTQPIISFQLICCLFSMAGIPPFAGFFSKFYIILNLINNLEIFFALLIICLSVIAAVYYIRLIIVLKFQHFNLFILTKIKSRIFFYVLSVTFLLQSLGLVWLPYLLNIVQEIII